MSRSSPTTLRFPAVSLARESERLLSAKTITREMPAITAEVLRAEEDRLASEVMRAVEEVRATRESKPEIRDDYWPVEACHVCGTEEDVDSDCIEVGEYICNLCADERLTGKPTRDDYEFDRGHDLKVEDR